ncbi:hypothetical protein [Streptomyces gibsoniae]|uniref:Uncharacterized protein n=1 Tax=Streptomyces gibsoniae TaxID=3075529 RepID=A0ABU2TTP5_9ACTN|nr:hypothetical protein [Streptomyces sp. DSM 41699]MDT0464332.1 hypothetical protein [Streptomyces sp. DSM 41699]
MPDGADLLDTYADERGEAARAVGSRADVQTRLWLLGRRHQVVLRDNALRAASGLCLFDLAYVPWLADLRTKYRTDAPAGGRAAGFVPGALVPQPLRGQLDDLRHTLILVGQPDQKVRELRRWCAERLGVVLDIRTVARRGRRWCSPGGTATWTGSARTAPRCGHD